MKTSVDESSLPRLLGEMPVRKLLDALEQFGKRCRQRGIAAYENDAVGELEFSGGYVLAMVEGFDPDEIDLEETTWLFEESGWDAVCSCPTVHRCAHAVALACAILAAAAAGGGLRDPRAAHWIDTGPRRQGLLDLPGAYPARLPPPKAPRARPSPLDRLRTSVYGSERSEAMDMILARLPGGREARWLLANELRVVLEREPDPDILCWRLANLIADRWIGLCPIELEPFRERPDIAAREEERERQRFEAEILAWTARKQPRPDRSIRVLVTPRTTQEGFFGLTFEVRLTSSRQQDEPLTSTQLRQLLREAEKKPGRLDRAEEEVLRALVQLDQNFHATWTAEDRSARLHRFLERLSEAPFAAFAAAEPGLAAAAAIIPGAPVRFAADPAEVALAVLGEGSSAHLRLVLRLPDGTESPLALAAFQPWPGGGPRGQSLALAGGRFYRVVAEPERRLLIELCRRGGIKVARERPALLHAVAAIEPAVARWLGEHTKIHAVEPIVALDLRRDDWIQIRLFARSAGVSGPRRNRRSPVIGSSNERRAEPGKRSRSALPRS